MAELTPEQLAELSTKVKRLKAHDEETEFHSAQDQALNEDRQAGVTARSRNHSGLWFRKLIPPGAG